MLDITNISTDFSQRIIGNLHFNDRENRIFGVFVQKVQTRNVCLLSLVLQGKDRPPMPDKISSESAVSRESPTPDQHRSPPTNTCSVMHAELLIIFSPQDLHNELEVSKMGVYPT